MATENRWMGRRYDGGVSPLGGAVTIKHDSNNMADALMFGKDGDTLIMPDGQFSTVRNAKAMLMSKHELTIEQFRALKPKEQNKIIKGYQRELRKLLSEVATIDQRRAWAEQAGELKTWLRDVWSRGELKLEKPQASSLHHMINHYEERGGADDARRMRRQAADTQLIIIEHEWARALPPSVSGEWRLPFREICWEFRISGVRVLAFTEAQDEENPDMFMTYGKDGVWLTDDYDYTMSGDTLRGKKGAWSEGVEFKRVAHIVWANIRAACIMLDAPNVAERQERQPSDVLVAKARCEGVTPPARYQVIRLMNLERRASVYRARGGGTTGIKQGGHWRRGTWVHYDDPDSGEVQYANDGGFIVSKSWRRWHFAGDPNRMVDKEYRL